MQALEFNAPWDISIVDRPDPVPGADHTLIQIIATGICGSDAHGYSGETGRRTPGQVMGHETVGRVVGASSELPAGALITINPIISCGHCEFCLDGETQVCTEAIVIGVDPSLDGSFAELLVVPNRNVVALGDNVPVLHGAFVEPLAVGYHAVLRGTPTAHDRMLILGGGPIGQAAALGARRAGVTAILVSEPAPERRDLLERLGFSTTTPDQLSSAVPAVLGGKATVVVDAVGIRQSFSSAMEHSTTRARVVLVGMGSAEFPIEPYGITVSERTLIGSYCYSEQDFRSTAEWVAEGHPDLDLLIDRTLPLSEGPAAFRSVAEGNGGSNKTLLLSTALAVGVEQ